ncbi:uncharacterized protein LOC143267579 [Peromyscus maniculatus bairdii]|uniref:uncharacterized protein LOC143267579 n=1 Tax=Peromyscus maniculatus bairdii TaxID=230844 RepID=UPI003FD42E8C
MTLLARIIMMITITIVVISGFQARAAGGGEGERRVAKPSGLSQEGRATANRRRRRLVRPPSLYRVPPAASSLGPCSCPSAAVAAQEGKSEEPAQKAAGQTPTSGRNKRRQRRARLRSFPVTRLSPPLQPLSPDPAACEAPGSPPSTVPLWYYCGGDYFLSTAHLTVHTLVS